MKKFRNLQFYQQVLFIRIVHLILGGLIAYAIFHYIFQEINAEFGEIPLYGSIGVSAILGYACAVFMSFFTLNTTKCSQWGANWIARAYEAPFPISFIIMIPAFIIVFVSFPIVFITYPFETIFVIRNAIRETKSNRATRKLMKAGNQMQQK